MADDLKVKLGVDVDALLRGMKRGEKSLEDFKAQAARFKAALDKATDPASIIRLNRAIEASAAKMKALQSAGTGVAQKVGKDFTGLSRIIQDLPFGFVGIQNNITQLLPAAGALGLVLSAVTTAITFAQVGTGAWTRGLNSNKKAIEDNKQSLEDFKSAQRSSMVEYEKQRVTIESLVAVIKSDVSTKDQQARALERLNKLIPDNIGVLTKQNITTAEGTRILNEYTKAIEARGIAELLSARIAELAVQQIDNRSNFTKELTQLLIKQSDTERKLLNQRQKFQISNNDFAKEKALREELANLQGQQIRLTNQYKSSVVDLNKQIANYRKEAVAAFTNATPLEEFDKEKVKKAKETISDVIKELRRELDFLNIKGQVFNVNVYKEQASKVASAIDEIIKKFKVDPKDSLIQKMLNGGTVSNIVSGENIPGLKGLNRQLEERVKKELSGPPLKIPIPVQPTFVVPPIASEADIIKITRFEEFRAGVNALASQMRDAINNAFGGAFEGIASGAKVQNIFGNFFKTTLSALGSGVQQLGIQALAVQKIIGVLKAAFGTKMGLGAAIGLIALGGIIKGLANRIEIPGFADGVTNFRGGLAMVGERGPEMVRLPSGADVVPNHSLGAIGGGMSMNLSGSFRVAGTDLVLVLERANKSLNRVG